MDIREIIEKAEMECLKEFNKIDNLYDKLVKEYELTIQMIENIE